LFDVSPETVRGGFEPFKLVLWMQSCSCHTIKGNVCYCKTGFLNFLRSETTFTLSYRFARRTRFCSETRLPVSHARFYSQGRNLKFTCRCATFGCWQVCRCASTVCRYAYRLQKKFWEELIAYFPWYDTDHIENDTSNNSSSVACVFVTAVTFLPSRCLAMIGGFLPRRSLATVRRFLPTRCLPTIGGHRQQHDLISVLYFSK
jgi:hypothetical protein